MYPRFEVLIGAVDGVNCRFRTSVPYKPKSFAGFLNGQLKRADFDDGWIETSPSLGVVTFKEPPVLGDVVQGFYVLTSIYPGEEVTPLRGRVGAVACVLGRMYAPEPVRAQVRASAPLRARMTAEAVEGRIMTVEKLRGRLAEVRS
jgi:hypothetical protein